MKKFSFLTQYWIYLSEKELYLTKGKELESILQLNEESKITLNITKWIEINERIKLEKLTELPEIIYIKKIRVDLPQSLNYWVIVNPKLFSKNIDGRLGIDITIQFDEIISTKFLEETIRDYKLRKLLE